LIDGQQAINGRYGELRWGSVKMGGSGGGCGITLRSWALRETEMDRVGLGEIEREIDAEARERFPGGAVRQVVLLQYGDDPEIEPGDLWVRVVLDADGPDDYERSVQAFQHDHEAAMEEFAGHLARTLREIRLVEFTPEKTVDREGHGPRCHLGVSERLADARAWELGEFTRVDMHTTLGRSGLETLDTLIMAGIADTRADAIRWALERIRERPAYERLRERIQEIDQLRNEF
jgi:hypothetical protein